MAARILVVNDTQEILELFRMLLEEEGYEVVLARRLSCLPGGSRGLQTFRH
jgi:DNA-binding response OmpR family regulator